MPEQRPGGAAFPRMGWHEWAPLKARSLPQRRSNAHGPLPAKQAAQAQAAWGLRLCSAVPVLCTKLSTGGRDNSGSRKAGHAAFACRVRGGHCALEEAAVPHR